MISILVQIQSEPVSLFTQLNMLALALWVDGKEIPDVTTFAAFLGDLKASYYLSQVPWFSPFYRTFFYALYCLRGNHLASQDFSVKGFRPLGFCPAVPLAWNMMNHLSFGSWSSPGLLGELCYSRRLKWPPPPSVMSPCCIFCVVIIVLGLSLPKCELCKKKKKKKKKDPI